MRKIQIRTGQVKVSAALRARLQRRLMLALGRFGDRITGVVVRFSGAGADQRCEIRVTLRREVRAEDNGADLSGAADRATDRVARAIERALARERD